MGKKEIVYTGKLENDTSLLIVKLESEKHAVITIREKKMTPICNLPGESFKLGESAIAVFSNSDGKSRLLRVYDVESESFVDKKDLVRVYDERFIKSQKVKKKI